MVVLILKLKIVGCFREEDMDKESLLKYLECVSPRHLDDEQVVAYWRLREFIGRYAETPPRKAVLLHREKDECDD